MMDYNEMANKIALAAMYAYEDWSLKRRWDTQENAMICGPMPWKVVAEAVVSEARAICTCESCKHFDRGDCENNYNPHCSEWSSPLMWGPSQCGCNNYEAKP